MMVAEHYSNLLQIFQYLVDFIITYRYKVDQKLKIPTTTTLSFPTQVLIIRQNCLNNLMQLDLHEIFIQTFI